MASILKSKKIIKVGVDGGDFIPFSQVKTGIQRIVDSFLKQLTQINGDNFIFNYYYFSGKNQPLFKSSTQDLTKINLSIKRLPKKLFASLFLPFYFKKDSNDVFLGFSGYLPKALNLFGRKKIVFLYDLGFFKYPQLYQNPWRLVENTLEVLKVADRIVVLSKYAKTEILKRLATVEPKKIVVIYPGVNHLFGGKEPTNQLINLNYFLYVGIIKPIKNIEGLFRIFYYFLKRINNQRYRLVLVGTKEEKYFQKLLNNRYYLKLKEQIVFKDNLSDQQLVNYYLQSISIVNFSKEEGFCFPIWEGLALGKKAIVNNLAVYHEFKPRFDNLLIGKNEEEIIDLMIKTAKNHSRSLTPVQSVKQYLNWKNFTERLLAIIEQI